MTAKPTTEQLQEEWVGKRQLLAGSNEEYGQIAGMHAACVMSMEYEIDIAKFMWKVCGVRAGTYDQFLQMFKDNGIDYYTD